MQAPKDEVSSTSSPARRRADTPRFASNARGGGTDTENRDAMARNIGFFGTYTVDENGAFSGNRVEA